MAIERINTELCIGCGLCVNCCPGDVIRLDNERKKAFVKYPEECSMCFFCLSECPQKAIIMSTTKESPLFTSWG